MLLQQVRKSYFGMLAITIILLNAKVGIFPPSYAVIPSFTSCFTTFYCLDPYFILNLIVNSLFSFFVITHNYTCMHDCSIRVTAELEYLK